MTFIMWHANILTRGYPVARGARINKLSQNRKLKKGGYTETKQVVFHKNT